MGRVRLRKEELSSRVKVKVKGERRGSRLSVCALGAFRCAKGDVRLVVMGAECCSKDVAISMLPVYACNCMFGFGDGDVVLTSMTPRRENTRVQCQTAISDDKLSSDITLHHINPHPTIIPLTPLPKSTLSNMTTREASHAGSWYSADPATLSRQLDSWLDAVPATTKPIGPVSSRGGDVDIPSRGARVIVAP